MIRKLLLAVILASLCLFAAPHKAVAFDLFGQVDCSGDQANSAVCTSKTSNDPLTGTNGNLDRITNIIAIVAGGAAIIVIIVSGLRYVTSGGDAEKVAKAKNGLIHALIGIAIVILARAIIDFVIGRL